MDDERGAGRDAGTRLVANRDLLREFSDDVAALWLAPVPVLDDPPSALVFLRDYVSRSRPCIIKNAILVDAASTASREDPHPPRPLTLTLDELRALVPADDISISVDVTPDGCGDCIRLVHGGGRMCDPKAGSVPCFVRPLQRRMTLGEFCHLLRRGSSETVLSDSTPAADRVFETVQSAEGDGGDVDARSESLDSSAALLKGSVAYYSQQNDCLRKEMSALWDRGLFPAGFSWAEEAFQTSEATGPPRPDAVNLWIGDRRSVSSMHKDHYENLFYVLSGEKVFTLCPPCDAPFLYERPVPSAAFVMSGGAWKVRMDATGDGVPVAEDESGDAAPRVHWVAADVTDSRHIGKNGEGSEAFPLLQHAHTVTVRVREGEMLYVPALFFHRVSQSCETVAINYWYDMNFESPSWCYFRLVQQLQHEEA
jgi:jumonji domain-containing protein 7